MPVARRLALIGCSGMLATAVRGCAGPEWEVVGLDLPEFDLTNREQVIDVLTAIAPQVILNCAAYTNVDGAEAEEPLALRVNGEGPGHLARAAMHVGATLVHISTDYVFDGTNPRPYREDVPAAPVSAYGRTKLAGEQAIIGSGLEAFYIVRTSWLYGQNGRNFVETVLRLALEREELRIVADQVGSPTYTVDLARAVFALLSAGVGCAPFGIYHYSNEGQCSWYEFACAIVALARQHGVPVKVREITPIRSEEYPLPAQRPAFSVFDKSKFRGATGATVPDWRESLAIYMQSRACQEKQDDRNK